MSDNSMNAVSVLPTDGGFLDGLKSIGLDALTKYTQSRLPTVDDRRDIAAIDVATQTALAQNQQTLANANADRGVSLKTILIGVSVVAVVGLFFAFRRR